MREENAPSAPGKENAPSAPGEKSPQSMLRWISRTYDMSPTALARMFQRNARTVSVWLKEGRISEKNGTRIRSAFYYLNNAHDPRDPLRSGIDMV